VPLVTVKRYVKLYRQGGVHAYFAPEKRHTGHKLSAEVRQHAQTLLSNGLAVPEVGQRVRILSKTLHKAIQDGRLVHNIKKH
jgi:ribosomal protein L21E